MTAAAERIQKIMARAGIGSRRESEVLIRDGLVTLNGKVAQLGDRAIPGKDAIKVRGKLLHMSQTPVYLLYYKPRAVLSVMGDDDRGRMTLKDLIRPSKKAPGIFPVGRMDFLSEGLLLLTNDGELAQKIQASKSIVRVYEAKVKGLLTEKDLEKLRKGCSLNGRKVLPLRVEISKLLTSKTLIEIAFQEAGIDVGGYLARRGYSVERIVRTALGHLSAKGLTTGALRPLTRGQAHALVEQPELGNRGLRN